MVVVVDFCLGLAQIVESRVEVIWVALAGDTIINVVPKYVDVVSGKG